MANPQIRPLDLADEATAAAVFRIGRDSYAVEAELIGFDGIPALRESLPEMRAQDLHWVGAVSGSGELTGFLAWEDRADGGVCIDRLCVAPARFRLGIASLLLRHALTELFPGRPVEVTTGAANVPAVGLYDRLGFVRGEDFSPAPGLLMASFTRGPGV
ncbi:MULTISPECIES: GNAT family N-acetyltransferase [unclassified Streptomyces]|uniref:GNAT family N-acetyltransferase n=1 Tax=unclassified Streptomyces TaxID=2593676 RepID=UPI002E2ECD37|nr:MULTISPECIES: GNAT family N-acetyltransferase [unclassified Streptomyces]WUC67290.1 GNAT family N-acetyltransferase [Streptomyces sp. NBC_00539]